MMEHYKEFKRAKYIVLLEHHTKHFQNSLLRCNNGIYIVLVGICDYYTQFRWEEYTSKHFTDEQEALENYHMALDGIEREDGMEAKRGNISF